VPKLGGQKADYLVAALQDYRARNRAHVTMRAQAAVWSVAYAAFVIGYLVCAVAAVFTPGSVVQAVS